MADPEASDFEFDDLEWDGEAYALPGASSDDWPAENGSGNGSEARQGPPAEPGPDQGEASEQEAVEEGELEAFIAGFMDESQPPPRPVKRAVSLSRRAAYLRPDLLILDDFGLKPIPTPGPEDLYDVINERYETGSILLNSNRAPNEWPDLFLDPLLASAGLDRLLDRAGVVIIRGSSYRAQGRNRLIEEVSPELKQP